MDKRLASSEGAQTTVVVVVVVTFIFIPSIVSHAMSLISEPECWCHSAGSVGPSEYCVLPQLTSVRTGRCGICVY